MLYNIVVSLLSLLLIVWSVEVVARYEEVHDPYIDVAILFDQSLTMTMFENDSIWKEMSDWIEFYYKTKQESQLAQFAVMGCGSRQAFGEVVPTLYLNGKLYNDSITSETDKVKKVQKSVEWERIEINRFYYDNVGGCACSTQKEIFSEANGDRPNAANVALYISDCYLRENINNETLCMHNLITESKVVFLFICLTNPYDQRSFSHAHLGNMLEWVGTNDSIFAFTDREGLVERLNKLLPKKNISVTDCNETVIETECMPQDGKCVKTVTSFVIEKPEPEQYAKACTENETQPCGEEKCNCAKLPWNETGGPCIDGISILRKKAPWCTDYTTFKPCIESTSTPTTTTTTSASTTLTSTPTTSTPTTTTTTSTSTTLTSTSTTSTSTTMTSTPTTTSDEPEKRTGDSLNETAIIIGATIGGLLLLILIIIIVLIAVFRKSKKKSPGKGGYNTGAEAEHLGKERVLVVNMESRYITEGVDSKTTVKTRALHADASRKTNMDTSMSTTTRKDESTKTGKSLKIQGKISAPGAPSSAKGGKSSISQGRKSAAGSPSSATGVKSSVSQGKKSAIGAKSAKSSSFKQSQGNKSPADAKSAKSPSSKQSQGKKSSAGGKSAKSPSSKQSQGKKAPAGRKSAKSPSSKRTASTMTKSSKK